VRGTTDAVVGVNTDGLRFAEAEAGRVGAALKAKPLIGPQATYTSVGTTLKAARRVHVASHVRFDPLNPFASEFALAGGDTMQAWEFAGTLREPDLVFLSGCETQAATPWQSIAGGVGLGAGTMARC
jgi:CHAT domain-containing protein